MTQTPVGPPPPPPDDSVAKAKAALLAVGEAAEEDRRRNGPQVRKYIMWISVASAAAGMVASVIAAIKANQKSDRRPGPRESRHREESGKAGISLGLILKLLKPALPLVMRFVAQRRKARQSKLSSNGRPRHYEWARA